MSLLGRLNKVIHMYCYCVCESRGAVLGWCCGPFTKKEFHASFYSIPAPLKHYADPCNPYYYPLPCKPHCTPQLWLHFFPPSFYPTPNQCSFALSSCPVLLVMGQEKKLGWKIREHSHWGPITPVNCLVQYLIYSKDSINVDFLKNSVVVALCLSKLHVNGVGFRPWPLSIQPGDRYPIAHLTYLGTFRDLNLELLFFLNYASGNRYLENCKKFILEAFWIMFGGPASLALTPAEHENPMLPPLFSQNLLVQWF